MRIRRAIAGSVLLLIGWITDLTACGPSCTAALTSEIGGGAVECNCQNNTATAKYTVTGAYDTVGCTVNLGGDTTIQVVSCVSSAVVSSLDSTATIKYCAGDCTWHNFQIITRYMCADDNGLNSRTAFFQARCNKDSSGQGCT